MEVCWRISVSYYPVLNKPWNGAIQRPVSIERIVLLDFIHRLVSQKN
jgi:hypothetical protein